MQLAHDDVEAALKRLVQCARDQHKHDPSKTAAEYYSETLGSIIAQAELHFDASFVARRSEESA